MRWFIIFWDCWTNIRCSYKKTDIFTSDIIYRMVYTGRHLSDISRPSCHFLTDVSFTSYFPTGNFHRDICPVAPPFCGHDFSLHFYICTQSTENNNSLHECQIIAKMLCKNAQFLRICSFHTERSWLHWWLLCIYVFVTASGIYEISNIRSTESFAYVSKFFELYTLGDTSWHRLVSKQDLIGICELLLPILLLPFTVSFCHFCILYVLHAFRHQVQSNIRYRLEAYRGREGEKASMAAWCRHYADQLAMTVGQFGHYISDVINWPHRAR